MRSSILYLLPVHLFKMRINSLFMLKTNNSLNKEKLLFLIFFTPNFEKIKTALNRCKQKHSSTHQLMPLVYVRVFMHQEPTHAKISRWRIFWNKKCKLQCLLRIWKIRRRFYAKLDRTKLLAILTKKLGDGFQKLMCDTYYI